MMTAGDRQVLDASSRSEITLTMSPSTRSTSFTPDDLLTLPDGDRYELVNGELVEKKMGFKSSFVGGALFALLWTFTQKHALGWVLPADASFQCFPDSPTLVRKPDVSFISCSRLPASAAPDGHCRIAPDLAAEVVSPTDLFDDVSIKVNEYLAAGVRLVWVIDPKVERVFVYPLHKRPAILTSQDELTGGDVLPGFQCAVAELFQPPPGTTPN
jgi:Uma2 family endonuclease